MTGRSTRLESALAAWLEFQKSGRSRAELLAEHPHLRELLEAFCEEDGGAGEAPVERVLGDYRLERELGRGGMGVVYQARQLSLDRLVAVKVLAAGIAGRAARLARFRREALHLARFDHPAILRVYDVGEQDGEHWLAMELVDGESLEQRLERLRQHGGHEHDSLRQLITIVEQIARALQHAHECGVVHRDVKPSNILLRRDGGAVLGDFGLARDDADLTLTQAGTIAGTPHYLSPEQVLHGSAASNARSDLFALGVTLYECITLQRPFDGATPEQILHRIVHRDPVDPRRLRRGLPADLGAIAQKALEKQPLHRYPSAGEFADDLRAFLELRPVQARPLSTLTRVRRWARREPLRAALAVAVVMLLALGGYLLLQLPDIRAAASGRRTAEYEQEFAAGLVARTGKDPALAYRHFHRALELFPGRGEAIAGLCLCIRHFEGPAAALAELERRTGTRTDDQDVERLRALLLRRTERVAEAAALEQRLGDPDTSTAMWLTAATLIDDRGEPAAMVRAQQLLSLATRIAPEPRLLLYAQWAAIEYLAGNPATRRECAETLLRLWPENPVALSYAGANLLRLEPARSAEVLGKAIALGLEDPLGRVNLSMALAGAGQDQAAAREAHAALAQASLRAPGGGSLHDEGRAMMIDLLHHLRDPGEGEECERWLRDAPDNLLAIRRMGQYCSMHDDHERALQLLGRAHQLAPDDPDVTWDLAFARSRAEDAAGATELLRGIVAAHPTHERAHLLLLDVYSDLVQGDASLDELQRWAEVKATDVRAWTELAAALLDRSGTDAAQRARDAAERADLLARGQDAEALELRTKALVRLGQREEAARLRARPAAR